MVLNSLLQSDGKGAAADGLSTMLFAATSGFGSNSGQWWTIGSGGGAAGTTTKDSLNWWNHSTNTNDWQSQLAAADRFKSPVNMKGQGWPRGVAL